MDIIITFFRDILDGYTYIIVSIVSGILICSCIGYLAEVNINNKKSKAKYEESHAKIEDSNQANTNMIPNEQLQQSVVIPQNSTQINTNYTDTTPLNSNTLINQNINPTQSSIQNQSNNILSSNPNIPNIPTVTNTVEVVQNTTDSNF